MQLCNQQLTYYDPLFDCLHPSSRLSIDCGGCFQRTDPSSRTCLPGLAHMHMSRFAVKGV